jgi:hypothetical protein
MSEALETIEPSAAVTLVPKELIALALVDMSPSAVVRPLWRVVTSAEMDVMLLSVVSTLVVREERPEAFADTPVVGSSTVDSSDVIREAWDTSPDSVSVVREDSVSMAELVALVTSSSVAKSYKASSSSSKGSGPASSSTLWRKSKRVVRIVVLCASLVTSPSTVVTRVSSPLIAVELALMSV